MKALPTGPRAFAARALAALALAAVLPGGAALAHDADPEEQALQSLIDAELAFSRMGAEQGIHAAFLANFSKDGVIFEPGPVRLVETWSARPANPDPKALKLEWAPAQAGVAKGLDMGFTTGPFKLSDTTRDVPPRQGVFFSVWRRDSQGVWKVALDMGIATPQAVDFVPMGVAPRPRYRGKADGALQQKALLLREARTLATAGAAANAGTYADLLAPDVRLHREGMLPLAGRAAVAKAMRDRAAHLAWTPQEIRVADSGDLAMSYGRYREITRSGKSSDGFYTHLWLRDAAGRWRIAYDIALPASR
ncbi:MAG: nuclear transport factor 2 family protein [Casimicrobiaceae bacterium]